MQSNAIHVLDYIKEVPAERRKYFSKLRDTILANLPAGFEEQMSYGMIGYVVPLRIYPNGYHRAPNLPLPFVNIASQKHHIALYHMGIYAMPELLDWFVSAYPNHSPLKLDMGKSCIRFRKFDQMPLQLIGELMRRVSVKDWIQVYESNLK